MLKPCCAPAERCGLLVFNIQMPRVNLESKNGRIVTFLKLFFFFFSMHAHLHSCFLFRLPPSSDTKKGNET